MKPKLNSLQKKLDYTFNNVDFLIQALTHSSYAYENQHKDISDNEVMEFLGDSVLGLIVADYLCAEFPELTEGELSKLKSLATNTSALSSFAQRLKLDKHLQLGKGEEKSGGRQKKNILAGCYEAVIAALYLDGGFAQAKYSVRGPLRAFFKKVKVNKFFVNNYKSALQEHLQKTNLSTPVYKTITSEGPNHKKNFLVEVFCNGQSLGSATGRSKKEAEQKAAQKALRGLLGRKIRSFTEDTFLYKKR